MNAAALSSLMETQPGKAVGASATTAHMTAGDKAKLKTAAVGLEASFTSFLLEELDKGLPGSSGYASQVYGGMLKSAIAEKVAASDSGSGLAKQIYTETLKLAGGSHKPGLAGTEPPPSPAPASILLKAPTTPSAAPAPAAS